MSINFDLLKPSASMEVTRIAGELKKAGRTVYPLSAGDTHFAPPQSIILKLAHLPAAYSHYTNAEGIDALREQISKSYQNFSASDVLLVPGLKQGLYYALAAIAQKTLCTLEPAWLGYEATSVMAGYQTLPVNMHKPNWLHTLNETVFDVILVCSPNNPDGKIFSDAEMDAIVEAAAKNNAWIITDFIYDRYIYEPVETSYNKLLAYPKLIIGNGFSKSHAITGFRVGYLMCNDQALKNRMLTMQQNLATCVPAISQYALVDAHLADTEISANAAYYKKNRDLVLNIFPEWEPYKPQGGFYYFIDLQLYGITDGQQFCEQLLLDTGIALVPGAAYGKGFDSYARLSFSIDNKLLEEALMKLKIYLTRK